jgi:hypothetical protein
MISFTDALVLIGMLVLRFGVPLAIIVGLGYLLKRLDRRWEREAREAEAAGQGVQPAQQPAAVRPQPTRRAGVDVPGPQLPFAPNGLRQGVQPGPALMATPTAQTLRHCWDIKGCAAESIAKCAAVQNPGVPCWQARSKAERQMPEACFDCNIYKNYPRI